MTGSWDMRQYVPDELREAIDTPHEHEDELHHRPVWIIWRTIRGPRGILEGPYLHAICDDREITLSYVGTFFRTGECTDIIRVERVPLNHTFGSSLNLEFVLRQVERQRNESAGYRYRRVGD